MRKYLRAAHVEHFIGADIKWRILIRGGRGRKRERERKRDIYVKAGVKIKMKIVPYKIFYLLAEKRIFFNFARARNTTSNAVIYLYIT